MAKGHKIKFKNLKKFKNYGQKPRDTLLLIKL